MISLTVKWRKWKCIFDKKAGESLRISKTLEKKKLKIVVFIAKVLLLTAKSKTGFQSFVQARCHWEINPDLDAYHTSIKTLQEKLWNAILRKVFEKKQLASTYSNYQLAATGKKIGKMSKLRILLSHSLSEKNKKGSYIHSHKSFFKAEKWPVSQEYVYLETKNVSFIVMLRTNVWQG